MSIPRRVFLMTMAAGGTVIGTGARAQAQAQVDEKEPQAVAVGYVTDVRRVDARRFPKYAAGQMCANCVLYQGKAADATGGCALFGGRQVAAKGWCSAWTKKA